MKKRFLIMLTLALLLAVVGVVQEQKKRKLQKLRPKRQLQLRQAMSQLSCG